MKNIKQLLGARIQQLRKKRHLTQETLAEKLDITPNYLSGIERGRQSPSLDLLVKLARTLEVELWEMFDFEHHVNKKELLIVLKQLSKEMDDNLLQLVVKVVRAMVR